MSDDMAHEIALARPRVARLAGALCVALLALLFASCAMGAIGYSHSVESTQTLIRATSSGAVVFACLAVIGVSLARSSRRRTLWCDAWGIREQQGTLVMSAIAWSEARAHAERSSSGWLEAPSSDAASDARTYAPRRAVAARWRVATARTARVGSDW